MKCLLLVFLLAGCTSNPSSFHLTKPPRPVLPTLTDADMACMDNDAYNRLIMRDRMRRWYAESLEAVIDSTRGK